MTHHEPKFTSDPEEYFQSALDYVANQHDMTKDATGAQNGEEDECADAPFALKPKRDDVVSEASWESFPASDPPSWSGTSVSPNNRPDEESEQ